MNLTGWYASKIRPVREGVYEIQAEVDWWGQPLDLLEGTGIYSYWDGKKWLETDITPARAQSKSDQEYCDPAAFQRWAWRGVLKEEPNVQADVGV